MGKSLLILFLIMLLPYGPLYASNTSSSREFRRANDLFAAAKFQDALTLYQKLLASPPHGVTVNDIYTRIGDSYFRLGSFHNALDAYRSALKDQKESLRPETQYWIGFCCFLLGRNADAVNEFLRIPERYPGSGMWIGTAYYWAGRASERMGRTEEAVQYYRKAGGNGRSNQGKFALKKAAAMKGKQEKSTNAKAESSK
jgi:tetratricopeptide (TPR) repeat protein